MRILISIMVLAAVAAAPAAAQVLPSAKSCLNNREIRAKRLAADTGYFAQTSSGWWHNAGESCPDYGPNRSLVTRAYNDRQCEGDLVMVFDAFSKVEYGSCVLGAWEKVDDDAVPPAKPK